ncbi:BamA/TamA family outer membrane protein [Pelistega ratti]|nr:BamA/TamA family outer membrane protein [Pelistega ratti]
MNFYTFKYHLNRLVSTLGLMVVTSPMAFAFEPFIVKDVQLVGIYNSNAADIFAAVPAKVGSTFTVEDETETLQNLYATGLFDKIRMHYEKGVIVIKVDERPKIASISLDGMTVFSRAEIIQSVKEQGFGEGEFYHPMLLRGVIEAIRKAYSDKGDYGVDIHYVLTPKPDNYVDVKIYIKESERTKVSFGIGYSSTDKISGFARMSRENIFGTGTNLSLSAKASRYNRYATLIHTDPYWTASGISRSIYAYYNLDRPYNVKDYHRHYSYEVRNLGIGVDFTLPLSSTDNIILGATFEHSRVKLPKAGHPFSLTHRQFIQEYGSNTRSVMLDATWISDSRDSILAPRKGSLSTVSAKVSMGDLRYYLLSAEQQAFWSFGNGYTFAIKGQADWGRTYNQKRTFPVIKNLHAGGIGSVRGYDGFSLGPRDPVSGDYLGGSYRVVANMQLFLPFPIVKVDPSLRWFIFADAGKVGTNKNHLCTSGNASRGGIVKDPCGWRYSAGVGISWESPIGPLQLSYGAPIHAKPGDQKQQFQFQLGTTF